MKDKESFVRRRGDQLTDSKRQTPSDSIGIPQMLTLKEVLIGVRPVVAKDFDFKMVAAPRTDKPLRATLGTNHIKISLILCVSLTR